jgi:DNA-binding transcriptional ArsR family regulator
MSANVSDHCELHQVHPDRVTEARRRLFSDETYGALAETFSALADSNRSKILYSLSNQELCVCDLACVVSISESAVSQHLRILRNLRLVRSRRDGRVVYYSLNDEHIQTLLAVCFEHIRHE